MVYRAIFPVAGMGTRFLPATKANPKEMMPIVDKPLIQFAVEEAVAAGVSELIFVTSSSKRAIEDHFDSNYELESKLKQQGKDGLLSIVRGVLPPKAICSYVRQPEALGLGHAVYCARYQTGNDPFAVLLADDLIYSDAEGCLQQMVRVHQETGCSVVAVQEIPIEDSQKYGMVAVEASANEVYRIRSIVEKPLPENSPSNLAVVGRYILSPRIMKILSETAVGQNGEIQLTDAIAKLLEEEPVYALKFSGTRYDCGNKLGYLQAILSYAVRHPEVGTAFSQWLRDYDRRGVKESA